MSLVTNVSTYIFETFSETPREIIEVFFSGEIEKTHFALYLIHFCLGETIEIFERSHLQFATRTADRND